MQVTAASPTHETVRADFEDVVEVYDIPAYLAAHPDSDPVTCGRCERTWDAKINPTPAARCVWEYEHEYDED